MAEWEYCILTAVATARQTQFVLAYAGYHETPPAASRLEIMAQLGRDGWELVAVHPLTTGIKELYFKRPRP